MNNNHKAGVANPGVGNFNSSSKVSIRVGFPKTICDE